MLSQPMADAPKTEFDRLSPRMRECLRLVYVRKRTGEIATILDIEEGTAKGYIADAVRVLGARDRIDAAERFHSFEALTSPTNETLPFSGVSSEQPVAPVVEAPPSRLPRWLSPNRQPGTQINDLTILQRLFWIAGTPIIVAVAFGMLAAGLRVFSDLVHAIWGFRH